MSFRTIKQIGTGLLAAAHLAYALPTPAAQHEQLAVCTSPAETLDAIITQGPFPKDLQYGTELPFVVPGIPEYDPVDIPEQPPTAGIQEFGFALPVFDATPAALAALYETYGSMPSVLRQSIREVHVSQQDLHLSSCGEKLPVFAYATSDQAIFIRAKTDVIRDKLIHEAAHTLTFRLMDTNNEIPGLENEWRAVAGDVYPAPDNSCSYLAAQVRFDTGLQEGCLSRYGRYNFLEDIAAFTEAALQHDRGYWIPLLDARHSSYDPRHEQKLRLLVKYGFIDKEGLDEILLPFAKKDEARDAGRIPLLTDDVLVLPAALPEYDQ